MINWARNLNMLYIIEEDRVNNCRILDITNHIFDEFFREYFWNQGNNEIEDFKNQLYKSIRNQYYSLRKCEYIFENFNRDENATVMFIHENNRSLKITNAQIDTFFRRIHNNG